MVWLHEKATLEWDSDLTGKKDSQIRKRHKDSGLDSTVTKLFNVWKDTSKICTHIYTRFIPTDNRCKSEYLNAVFGRSV